jgi:glycosyltransferase involved in cell wall biosynthesis
MNEVQLTSSESDLQWLDEFRRRHGRPLRVLHFGNIANNAYLNAKFLRAVGIDAQVMSSDYDHIMATPEWEELEIIRPYGDERYPEFSLVDLKGYRRPEWFIRGRINECAKQIESQAMRSLLTPTVPAFSSSGGAGAGGEAALQGDIIAAHLEYIANKIRNWIDDLERSVGEVQRNSDAQVEKLAHKAEAEAEQFARRAEAQAEELARRAEAQLGDITAQVRVQMSSIGATLSNQIAATADRLNAISTQIDAVSIQIEWIRARLLRSWSSALRESAIEMARHVPGVRRVYRALRYSEPLLRRWPGRSPAPSLPKHEDRCAKAVAVVTDTGALESACPKDVPLAACAEDEYASAATTLSPPPTEEAAPVLGAAGSVEERPEIARAISDFASLFPDRPDRLTSADLGPFPGAAGSVEEEPEIARAISDFASLFPDRPDRLTSVDLVPFVAAAPQYRKAFEHFDVVQCYGTHPLWGYLAGNRPYIGFEHGTLRDFTLADNTISRLTALGYRRADHTFITNGDCLAYANAIGISNYSAMIHPVDVELHRRELGEPRATTKKRFEADILLFCPLRHDWKIKGTDVHLRALPLIRASVPGRVVLLLIDWGLETAASRALLAGLDCQDRVVWLPPLSRILMARLMRAADVVLDQIALPHFGATAPQALAAETPVISSYRPESTDWIVGEPAPILPAFSPDQVRGAVLTALDPEWRDAFRQRARRWVDTYHHPERLVKEHVRVYRHILGRSHGFGSRPVAAAI